MRNTLVILLVWWTGQTAYAVTNFVQTGNYWFNPTNLTITAGDSVIWTNVSLTAHDSTSSAGLWSSPTFAFRGAFRHQFTNAGIFPYFCALHIAARPEQTGMVTVVSTVLPSAVALTRPQRSGIDYVFSFTSQAGASYAVLRSPSLPGTSWTTVSNVLATGTNVWITNRPPTGAAYYYQVESR